MKIIKWNSFKIQTDSHAVPPIYSNPGLAVNGGSMWLPDNVKVLTNSTELWSVLE